MKVFQGYIIQGSWIAQKNLIIDSNFGTLCMKKGGSFQKERFSFFFSRQGGGVDPRNLPMRTPLTPAPETVTMRKNNFALKTKKVSLSLQSSTSSTAH